MFDIDMSEFAVIGIVALLVVGPKDLPRLMRTVGQWVGRARGMARHVRSGFDTMVREAEIDEMNKRWAKDNATIMAATAGHSYLDATSAWPEAHDPAPALLDAPLVVAPDPVPVPDLVAAPDPHKRP